MFRRKLQAETKHAERFLAKLTHFEIIEKITAGYTMSSYNSRGFGLIDQTLLQMTLYKLIKIGEM
jgi:hypothetical protein